MYTPPALPAPNPPPPPPPILLHRHNDAVVGISQPSSGGVSTYWIHVSPPKTRDPPSTHGNLAQSVNGSNFMKWKLWPVISSLKLTALFGSRKRGRRNMKDKRDNR